MKPRSVEVVKTPQELKVRVDAYEALGYKVKPYREGHLITKPYFGHWLIHLALLVVFVSVLGPTVNILYACWARFRSRLNVSIYLRQGKAEAASLKAKTSSRKKVPPIIEADWKPAS